MKNIVKLIAGLCLGAIVTVGVGSSVQAAAVYYIKDDKVYAADSQNPYLTVKLPSGTVIPAGSTVYTDWGKKSSWVMTTYGPVYYAGPYMTQMTTGVNTKIGYDSDGDLTLSATYSFANTGDYYLAKKAMEYQYTPAYVPTYASVCTSAYAPACIPGYVWGAATPADFMNSVVSTTNAFNAYGFEVPAAYN